jgi:hypothetical protein
MTKDQLQRKIARLESLNDHLMTELTDMNELMRLIGFAEGIKTVKATAHEMLRHEAGMNEDGQDAPPY